MMKNKNIILYILVIFGLFIILFLGFHYSILLNERRAMNKTLELLGKEVSGYKSRLETEQKVFEAKLTEMVTEREMLQREIEEVKEKFNQTQSLLSQVKQEMESLKGENRLLSEKATTLEEKLSDLNEEKLELERRFSSLKELRKAIRAVKVEEYKKRLEALKRVNEEALRMGNRGYLIKDGKPTLHPKYIIRVLPAKTNP